MLTIHESDLIVGPESLNANIGSLYSRVVGPTHPATAMPTSAVLFPQTVSADAVKGHGRGDLAATGAVGGCTRYSTWANSGSSRHWAIAQLGEVKPIPGAF